MGNTVESQRNLTKRQKEILIGLILGDGCLEKNGKNVRLRVEHGLAQRGYINWKYKKLKNLITGKPRIVSSIHYGTGKIYRRLHFSTFAIPELNDYWHKFYFQKRKRVPKNIKESLKSPLSLAIWYMDDGYKRNDCNALRISTDCFSMGEQKLLQQCLKDNFGIKTSIHRKGRTWNIYIPSGQTKMFCKIVKPYIIKELRYKISLTP
jgi:hypothetical protein